MIYELKSTTPQMEIDLRGRLTFSDYSIFREISDYLNQFSPKSCLLDLKDLEFIDSAGLGMLLIVRDKVTAKNGTVVLKNSQGQVKKMLTLGNFESLFSIE
ncbi:MAG: STAS domain-containing protein [Alphaproteobacteria bacterium]|nr:STAS domain-containing protein [Alphaproteobacteria bacterium]